MTDYLRRFDFDSLITVGSKALAINANYDREMFIRVESDQVTQ